MRRWLDLALLFSLGAVIGTGADQIHVQAAVLSYAHPAAFLSGQAIWVPLLFGSAGVVLTLAHAALLRSMHRAVPFGSPQRFAASLLAFLAAYGSTALFQNAPLALALGLLVAWAFRVVLAPAADKMIAGPLLALGGSLFESLLSSTGAFHYRSPDFASVPAWLPTLYLHASLMVREGYLAFFAAPRRARLSRAAPSS